MTFSILNKGPMTLAVPDWQTDFISALEKDPAIEKAVLEANEQFAKLAKEALERAADGYQGTAVDAAMHKVPRYIYKRLNDIWVATIDLLLRKVTFEVL